MRPKCVWTAAAAIAAGLLLWGCGSKDTVYVDRPDVTAPGVPRGVSSITGDEQVTIVWLGSTEEDIRSYIVYRDENTDSDELYDEIARINVNEFQSQWTYVDYNVQNSDPDHSYVYYYAVSAIDYDDNESELSYEDVFDTPRPEGFNVFIDATSEPSAFDFSAGVRVPSNSNDADIVVTFDQNLGALFIEAAYEDVDLQDFGFTDSMDDVDWSPLDGWTSVGWSEVIVGHSYIVWTADDNYAKLRVFQVDSTTLRFDWAYQADTGNPELKPVVPDSLRVRRNRPSGAPEQTKIASSLRSSQ